ncbi:hypothetical protein GCM10023184_19020 [Flaviaesturariibacter amylovorans]|uniref:Uncharacterized protein n=1 Tax=Flaviaesturariibacter amylovorans TaxID=1084520 RepID=A0ABP8GS51_9BACT
MIADRYPLRAQQLFPKAGIFRRVPRPVWERGLFLTQQYLFIARLAGPPLTSPV